MQDDEWNILIGLGVLASSHLHLKIIARTWGSVLGERFTCMGLGGRVVCWGGGAGVKLVLS